MQPFDMNKFDKLIGKKIKKMVLSEDKEHIFFTFDDYSRAEIIADAECCSNSWFEHVEMTMELNAESEALEIIDVIEKTMPEEKTTHETDGVGLTEHIYIRFYGWSIVTPKGAIDIEMRNKSNGYYGGSVSIQLYG